MISTIMLNATSSVDFYFTYEELKHIWNIPFRYILIKFLLYLWGIETLIDVSAGIKNFVVPFLLYLWGIETKVLTRMKNHIQWSAADLKLKLEVIIF